MDIDAIYSEIKKVKEENEKFAYMKKRYIEYSQKLVSISESLSKLQETVMGIAHEIDPVINIKVTNSSERQAKREKLLEVRRRVLEQMQSGQQVTAQYLKSAFPDIIETQSDIQNTFLFLRKQTGVKITKDGKLVRLFIEGSG